jgi:exodeoxyribonuclease V alpha subunit
MLTGRIKKIIFHDEESGFFIFALEAEGTHKASKAKGTFLYNLPTVGQIVTLTGTWESSKYGDTLNVDTMDLVIPETTSGMAKYLETYIPFIGPVLARRLVDTFGEQVIEVLNSQPERLEEVPHLNSRARQELLEAWEEQRYFRSVALELIRLGFSKAIIQKAYERWGANTLDELQLNPYVLMQLSAVGFVQADKAATTLGVLPDAQVRVQGVMRHALTEAAQQGGHLYLTIRELYARVKSAPKKLGVVSFGRDLTTQDLLDALNRLKSEGEVIADGDAFYLAKHHFAEVNGANILAQMVKAPSPLQGVNMDTYLEEYQRVQGITLSQEQLSAVRQMGDHSVMLVTGLPGTGKTTVSRALVKLFKDNNIRFELVSPTGIAAKRLSLVVGHPAATVHRTLGYNGESWEYGPSNPLGVDAVLVDEASMLDQSLFTRLLGALKQGVMVVLVGDAAQLPSVGAGNVLHELIESKVIPRVALTQIFRQGETSGIILGAHKINAGEVPVKSHKDFMFLETSATSQIIEQLQTLVTKIQGQGDRDVTFQVLSPRWKGALGVTALNECVREVLNPDKGQKSASLGKGLTLRVGDRVIVTQNNYKKGVFNGEQGTIVNINAVAKEIEVRIRDGHTKLIPFTYAEARKTLNLAFVITIHKCVHPDTRVETPEGLLCISDLPSSGQIATPEGVNAYQNKVTLPETSGLRITTEGGYNLGVTLEHGLDVWDGKAYSRREAQELVGGEFLRFKRGVTCDVEELPLLPDLEQGESFEGLQELPAILTEDAAEFLGLVLAGGFVFDSGLRFVASQTSAAVRFSELVETLFGCVVSGVPTPDSFRVEVVSPSLSQWLSTFEGWEISQKGIPDVIFRSPLRCQKAFLRGLFVAAEVTFNAGRLEQIDLSQANSVLLDEAQVLLLRVNVISVRQNQKNLAPTLSIYGASAREFQAEIGFISVQESLNAFGSCVGVSPYGEELVPLSSVEVESLEQQFQSGEYGSDYWQNVHSCGYLSRSTLLSMLLDLEEVPTWLSTKLEWHHERLQTLCAEIFQPVCVEVPQGHRFLQNGCSGWNSQGNEFDYVLMPFVDSYNVQLQRNLLYTAITRAKKRVFMLGHWSAMQRAVTNNSVAHRNTKLAERLRFLLLEA